jgi:hypothetical protein
MRLLQFMFGIIFVGIIGTGMPAKPKTIRGAQFIAMEWLVGLQTAASQHLNSAREPRAESTDSAGSTCDISLGPDVVKGSLGDCHEEFPAHPWYVCRSRLL